MKVLMVPLGTSGDVYPLVGIGKALKQRGHHVEIIANAYFEPVITHGGLTFIELGTVADYRSYIESPGIWDPIGCIGLTAEWLILRPLQRTFEIIEERFVAGATVIVAPLTAFGARIAQEKLGIPLVSVALHPACFRSLISPPKLSLFPFTSKLPACWNRFWYWLGDVAFLDRVLSPATSRFRESLQLPCDRGSPADWWFSPDRVLGLFPDWFAPPQRDWPEQVRLTGFPGDGGSSGEGLGDALKTFIDSGDPPIVFSPGSAMSSGLVFFQAAAEACHRLGRRGVFISRFPNQMPPILPSGVRSFDHAPFGQLLTRSAAIVHHGGIGTSASALAAGIPQVVMPMAYDQHDNADRLRRMGVARVLAPRNFQGPQLARTLNTLLDSDEVDQACRHYGEMKSTDIIMQRGM